MAHSAGARGQQAKSASELDISGRIGALASIVSGRSALGSFVRQATGRLMAKRTKLPPRASRGARINIRLHDHLHAALLAYAREDGRSLSSYVERVLVEYAREKGAPLDVTGQRKS